MMAILITPATIISHANKRRKVYSSKNRSGSDEKSNQLMTHFFL